jgi:neutral ceramidase
MIPFCRRSRLARKYRDWQAFEVNATQRPDPADPSPSSHLWKAGAAAVPITPTEAMWLAGWAARREPSRRKAMELFAKALALEDSTGRRVLIITADLLAIPRGLADKVAAKIQSQWQLPRECILFNASHTHTAPEVRPDKVPFFEIPPQFADKIAPYVESLENLWPQLADRALQQLQPAHLRVAHARVQFAVNRRPQGGPNDPEVQILQAVAPEGKMIAILFGLACHNLTLPPSFCEYHGDYAGVAQHLLEQQFPGSTALFLSGAGADQDPSPRGTAELVEGHGKELAEAVASALQTTGNFILSRLHAVFEQVGLDFEPLPPKEVLELDAQSNDLPKARKAKFLLHAIERAERQPKQYPCPVQVFNIGEEVLLVALGGEPLVEYALNIKREFPDRTVWVAGYSNDGFGYLPTRRVLREGGYEGVRSLYWSAFPSSFTEATEEKIMSAVRRLGQQQAIAGKRS